MKVALASACAGLAAWCSVGTIGFLAAGDTITRVGLAPPWWWLPLLVAAFFSVARLMRLTGEQVSPLFGSAVLLLPWLPVPLPAAAFLWTGPLTVVIWMVVLGAVVHAFVRASWSPVTSRWLTDASRAPVLAACVAVVLYGASARWLAPILPDGDSPHYLVLAQSLIRDGDIQIENNHTRGDYLEYSLLAAQPDYLRRGVNGQIYSIHAPGLPAIIAPAMWLFGYPGVVALLGIVAAITTGVVWWLASLVTGDWRAAWFAWACCALTTPFFFLATEVFPDGLAAACVLIGTLPLLFAERDERVGRDWHAGVWAWWAAGAALAVLPWLQTRLASLAAVAALLLLLRMRNRRELVAFATLPLLSAAGWFAFFGVVYGTPNPAAPYGALTQSSVSNIARGLPGVLFDQQFGLIANAPIYGVVLCGCLLSALRLRRYSFELLALTVPYTLSVAMYQHWWGGASAPGRLLTPLTPLFGLAAARLWAEGRASIRVLYATALGLSIYIAVLLCVPAEGRLLINFRDGIALWAEWVHDDVALARALPSLFVGAPAGAVLKAAIWTAVAGAFWMILRLLISQGATARGRPGVSWLAIWSLAVPPMIAVTLAWRFDGRAPITTARSEVGLLRRLASQDRWAYDYSAGRLIAGAELRSRLAVRSDDQRPRSKPSHVLSAWAVPPGRYRLQADARSVMNGTLTLRIGDTTLPFLTTAAAAVRADAPEQLELTLPVAVQSVVIEADAAASRTVSAARLQALSPPDSFEPMRGSARRAARYAAADAFFEDDNAYPEPTGFWVAGGRRARTVIAHDGPQLTLFLRNAPVENVVTIEADGVQQELTLAPGEERELKIATPQAGRVTTLRVHSQSGFRPSEREPGNRDLRYLGCWVEPR